MERRKGGREMNVEKEKSGKKSGGRREEGGENNKCKVHKSKDSTLFVVYV
jgi:hypothetical protein